ncbi:hypothetical protein SLS62_004089 [Diatrype stigma]|uniref:Uncharacterized protein n=1 Tax=Diatrype stigma TaxID=117547 RepID=A0AAN9URZ6_9PEZI
MIGQPSALNPSIRQQEQIRDLQAELSELKALLSNVRPVSEGHGATTAAPHGKGLPESDQPGSNSRNAIGLLDSAGNAGETETPPVVVPVQDRPIVVEVRGQAHVSSTEIADPKDRSPKGYYNRHSLFQFFGEVRELFPFIRELAEEWFKPLGVHLSRNKPTRKDTYLNIQSQCELALEALLPPKDDTDALVSVYLDQLERLHRIVHIPSFRKEYANFWVPGRARPPAMTVLVLAMISMRIFSVLRELDLRNAFESGLPSLLHNVPSNISPPSNIDDEEFDEKSKKLPEAKPLSEYTFSSYQALSARSWPLRLETSQRLFSARFSKPLDYDEVLRYTHEVTQAINAIPLMNTDNTEEDDRARGSALSFLQNSH